jgi:hypothetical protein
MFEIQQEILAAWSLGRKTKHTQSGWISGNAACCHHNGHNTDLRGRAGMIASDGGVSYHCFNCGFTAGWQPGRRITLKMRKLLGWLGVDEDDVRRLSLFALSNLDASLDIRKEAIYELPKFEPRVPCPGNNLLDWLSAEQSMEDRQQVSKIINYIDARGLGDRLDQLHWSPEENLRNRVLVPFSFLNQPMGYSGRLIFDGRPKYYSDHPPHFVYGYDNQKVNAKFCLVMEGLFDALGVDGLAVTSNECSEEQALIIDSLNREVIVVPDRDKAGKQLVLDAMKYGWNVAFPDWAPNIKDASDAVRTYGQLFTMSSILDSVETSNLKIQLRLRKWITN